MSTKTNIIEITSAEYIQEYKIRLNFNDRTIRVIDFEHFLKDSLNPMTRKYLKKALFRKYRIEYGDLIWGDYEMSFPIWDLYEGNI